MKSFKNPFRDSFRKTSKHFLGFFFQGIPKTLFQWFFQWCFPSLHWQFPKSISERISPGFSSRNPPETPACFFSDSNKKPFRILQNSSCYVFSLKKSPGLFLRKPLGISTRVVSGVHSLMLWKYSVRTPIEISLKISEGFTSEVFPFVSPDILPGIPSWNRPEISLWYLSRKALK